MTLPENEECQSSGPPAKKIKLDDSVQTSSSDEVGLLTFCDDLLLEIFSYLKPTDLLALSQCSPRLEQVVWDRTLWLSVDFRPVVLSHSELSQFVKFFLPATKLIATKGPYVPPWHGRDGEPNIVAEGPSESPDETTKISFTGDLLESISKAAPNLTTLILENHIINSQEMTWDKVPPKLEHLSLRSSNLVQLDSNKSFFFLIDKYLPNLKVLDITNCRWFEPHSLLALSKCQRLQELRMADCQLMSFVPYVSLGTRFGFKALTVVDFRRTWVSDREVSCLNKTPTLRELYLEAPAGERGNTMISDLAVTAFGGTVEEWNRMGYHVVVMENYEGFMPSALSVIEMCEYVGVTDTSLRHCASCLKGLKQLNVRGTSCTRLGIMKFKLERPDVLIESNFDLELDFTSDDSNS